jgi:hypothetical protein
VVGIFSFRSSRWYLFVSHHWLTIAFVLGFFTDLLLLNQIDNTFDNLVLLFYVILATVSLVLFYVSVADRGPGWLVRFLARITPITMQYSFGGLLSGMLIFYGRSGDWLVSAPYLALIILVILLNELVKKKSERLLYSVSVYFIGVFSYCVLIVPVWLGKTGDVIFFLSGLLAVAITMLLIRLLNSVIPNFLTLQKRLLVFSVGCLYALFNGFYYFNIIPPIPLSLTELSIYQGVERTTAGDYRVLTVQQPWYRTFSPFPLSFHPVPGQGAACFARVYAPFSLKTTVVQRWEYKNRAGKWVEYYKQAYTITGENKGGYRGYTAVKNLADGEWRCGVENERGQVLGRKRFIVDSTVRPEKLVTVIK